jgi:hypothetical protein
MNRKAAINMAAFFVMDDRISEYIKCVNNATKSENCVMYPPLRSLTLL